MGSLADVTNAKLRELGREERVDHRSYTRQGVEKEPGQHVGPRAPHMVHRGQPHDRLDEAADVQDLPDRIATLEREIGDLEQLRAQLARDASAPDLESTDWWGGAYGPGYTRSDDSSRGR
jgi:nucleotidyltransferase/DNA polymerase involved in DNA repair